jgi:pyruvate dehydrogenase E1 component beta subunit
MKREGDDITLIATSSMIHVAVGAAQFLEDDGISAEVVDPRSLWPLDQKTLIESAKKTSRVIVLDEGYERYGVTAEIASVIASGAFYHLDKPVCVLDRCMFPSRFPRRSKTLPFRPKNPCFKAARALCGRS